MITMDMSTAAVVVLAVGGRPIKSESIEMMRIAH